MLTKRGGRWSALVRAVVIATTLVVLATGLRILVRIPMGDRMPWVTFFPAVTIAAITGGMRAGLLAIGLSVCVAFWLWPLLTSTSILHSDLAWLGMALFTATGALISVLAERMRYAKADALQAKDRAETAYQLLTGHAKFVTLVADAVPGLVAYWGRDLRCKFANNRYLEWYGKTPDQMVGMRLADLLGEDAFAEHTQYILHAMLGEHQQFERTRTQLNGQRQDILVTYTPDKSAAGVVNGFTVFVMDITDRKKAESEQRLAQSVFDNTNEGIVVLKEDGTIQSVNEAFTDITGFTAIEARGQSPQILHSDQQDKAFCAELTTRLNAQGKWSGETIIRRKNGETVRIHQTISQIQHPVSDSRQFVSVFHEVEASPLR